MPRPEKSEIIEGLASWIWFIGGGTRSWEEGKAAAADQDDRAMEAVNRCYHFADQTYYSISKLVVGG